LSDGGTTEVVTGELKEGDAVVTGIEGMGNSGPPGARRGQRQMRIL